MNLFWRNRKDRPEDIFCYRPGLAMVDTAERFAVSDEQGKLRVRNDNANCLFSNLRPADFHQYYNEYYQRLNLNFDPLTIAGRVCCLGNEEKQRLLDKIITYWIYFYTINNIRVKVKRSDFCHPNTLDFVLTEMDKKYGEDTTEALACGAHLLRQKLDSYEKMVKARRRFYSLW